MPLGKSRRVIIGLPIWGTSPVCDFAATLARGLSGRGCDVRILLTEEHTPLVRHTAERTAPPPDLAVDRLRVGQHDGWAEAWSGVIRYLEERAPCIWISNQDWRSSCVSPLLSNRVRVVGVIHEDTPVEYERAARLGRYWNAIVAADPTVHHRVASGLARLAPRLVEILVGVPMPETVRQCGTASTVLRIVHHAGMRDQNVRWADVLAIAEALDRRGVAFYLASIGSDVDPASEPLSRALQSLGRLHVVSSLEPDARRAALAASDIYMLTSEYAAAPHALLDAMAQGCVPVVSDIEMTAAIVRDSESGFRVPVGDVDACVARVAELAANPSLRAALGAAARARVHESGWSATTMVDRYLALFERVEDDAERGIFRRTHRPMSAPPAAVDGASVLPGDHPRAVKRVNALPRWPDPVPQVPASHVMVPPASAPALGTHRIVVALTSGRISGVDIFAVHLARALAAEGYRAELVLTTPMEQTSDPLPIPVDVPLRVLDLPENPTWRQRWRAMLDYLARNGDASCIYVPNYDWRHSCIIPTLPPNVRAVGIAHSDDPAHYEHILRLSRYWDAVVAVSETIANELRALDPSLAGRLQRIPYGVPVPTAPPKRRRDDGAPLRAVYAGRLARHQKRALDLPGIAAALQSRGIASELTVIGNGPEQGDFLAASADVLTTRQLRYVGALPNEEVLQLFAESDVFVLPSSFEGLPVSLLEAMAHGCVPVVSDIRSGVPEIVRDGVNGFVVPVGDIEGFADRLALLAGDECLRQSMAAAAHRAVRNGGFRLEEMTSRYVALFERVAAGGYQRPSGPVLPPANLRGLPAIMSALPVPLRRVVSQLRSRLLRMGV